MSDEAESLYLALLKVTDSHKAVREQVKDTTLVGAE